MLLISSAILFYIKSPAASALFRTGLFEVVLSAFVATLIAVVTAYLLQSQEDFIYIYCLYFYFYF